MSTSATSATRSCIRTTSTHNEKQCVRDQQHNTTPEAGAKVHRDNQLDVFTARVCGCCCARNIKVRGGKPAQRLAMGVAELPQGNNVFSVLCQQCMLGGERDLCHERRFFFLSGGWKGGGSTSDPSPKPYHVKLFFGERGRRGSECARPHTLTPNRSTRFNGARTLTPIRVTAPHGARSARGWLLRCHGGACGATHFFSTLLYGFLCKSDSCAGLILVQG